MFTWLMHQQTADLLKKYIGFRRNLTDEQRAALEKLGQFERAPWRPDVLTAAAEDVAPGRFAVGPGELKLLPGAPEDTRSNPQVIADLLDAYLRALPHRPATMDLRI